jgi:hypothetical protein
MLPRPLSLPEVSELLRDGFNKSVARELYAQGEEVVIWVMLQLAVLATTPFPAPTPRSLDTPPAGASTPSAIAGVNPADHELASYGLRRVNLSQNRHIQDAITRGVPLGAYDNATALGVYRTGQDINLTGKGGNYTARRTSRRGVPEYYVEYPDGSYHTMSGNDLSDYMAQRGMRFGSSGFVEPMSVMGTGDDNMPADPGHWRAGESRESWQKRQKGISNNLISCIIFFFFLFLGLFPFLGLIFLFSMGSFF